MTRNHLQRLHRLQQLLGVEHLAVECNIFCLTIDKLRHDVIKSAGLQLKDVEKSCRQLGGTLPFRTLQEYNNQIIPNFSSKQQPELTTEHAILANYVSSWWYKHKNVVTL